MQIIAFLVPQMCTETSEQTVINKNIQIGQSEGHISK